jgi:hypothetical protein
VDEPSIVVLFSGAQLFEGVQHRAVGEELSARCAVGVKSLTNWKLVA